MWAGECVVSENFWTDRRIRSGHETAGELAKKYNRQNYRLHPEAQQAAVEGSLDDIGIISPVSVSEKVDKLFDGHLRVELALLRFGEDFRLPVDYYDLDEAETKKALLYRDMTAQMAEIDIPLLQELRFELPEFENPSFDEFLTAEFDLGLNDIGSSTPPKILGEADTVDKSDRAGSSPWQRIEPSNKVRCLIGDIEFGIDKDIAKQWLQSLKETDETMREAAENWLTKHMQS